ncbi:LppX_LprAFG lipoprotein [Skermania sp. ID1734]|uniref:LppX_LprAFG lipoprotein n=1 Tax=Skermania sp. ID1734 TaxID=2597516 RepID=UPI00117FEA9B|nr:LppX_LprAFG lipoprotein [Skermania sp. ID1734]TSE01493.1 LppX_LprAFG lipoprotein [Skermania sp. ID1734]
MAGSKVALFITALVAALLAMTGCSSSSNEKLPDAATTLREAAAAARNLHSVHITLTVNDDPPGMALRGVDGDVATGGNARGTLRFNLSGALIEGEFVVVGKTAYFKGPTGGFQTLSAERTASIYDSSALLDPQRGIANVLAHTTAAKTDAVDNVGDVRAYKVSGKVTKAVIAPIVPGVSNDVDVTYWLRADGERDLLQLWLQLPNSSANPTVQATLSNFNKPFTVTPPS